jgi:hypothetical protein
MADARVQYIQERLEHGLDGWNPSPSVTSFLDQAKNKQVSSLCPLRWRYSRTQQQRAGAL